MTTTDYNNGNKVTITFPTTSLAFGDVKVNGTVVGFWGTNCEMRYHAKFMYNGKTRNAWGDNKRDMTQSALECISLGRTLVL